MSVYDGQSDEQLMELAKRAMVAAAEEEPGSIERAMKWAGYESVMRELARRLARHLNDGLGLPDL